MAKRICWLISVQSKKLVFETLAVLLTFRNCGKCVPLPVGIAPFPGSPRSAYGDCHSFVGQRWRCLASQSRAECRSKSHSVAHRCCSQETHVAAITTRRESMENRQHAFKTAEPHNSAVARDNISQWPPTGMRPLSDIREITEPSLIDMVNYAQRQSEQVQSAHQRKPSRSNSMRRGGSISRKGSVKAADLPIRREHARTQSAENGGSSSYSSTPEASSCYAIPQSSVPRRSSSRTHLNQTHSRKPSIRSVRADDSRSAFPVANNPPETKLVITNHGPSRSPVKDVSRKLNPVSSDVARKMPSKTYVRSPAPTDILDFPVYRHPRLKLELHISAPLFVGGGSVEGHVKVTVDDNERLKHHRSLGVASTTIDLIGFEEVAGHRRATFLALGTELMDSRHPPPSTMVEPDNPLLHGERFWTLKPSISALPFMLSLPLDTGPPPFSSKQANIRFLLCVTATIRDAGKRYRVRTSQDICVVPTYDPERALTSLPSPLVASDELSIQRWGATETLNLTAGLYRQVWVSGSSIFVDLHISNKTHKHVKRVELSLERVILCYKHAAAAPLEKASSQSRISESNDRLVITRSTHRHDCDGWSGTGAYTSDARTCELQVPRGHATVKCGKYFEVRYFLNITASISNSKLVSVQLPIILVHMNSLDVLPNSVAQVAAAIEEKRLHQRRKLPPPDADQRRGRHRSSSSPARMTDLDRRPSYTQGRAFAAPRQQSLSRRRAETGQMEELQQMIDNSPRKHPPRTKQQAPPRPIYLQNHSSAISFGALSLEGKSSPSGSLFGSIRYHTPPPKPRNVQPAQAQNGPDVKPDSLRDRLRRMHSFDSMHSKKSIARMRPIQLPQTSAVPLENLRPLPKSPTETLDRAASMRRYHIAPHTLGLGLASTFDGLPTNDHTFPPSDGMVFDNSNARPATAMNFREKLDRSRFEFKAVRRRASGGIRGRGKQWFEKMRQKDGDGVMSNWI